MTDQAERAERDEPNERSSNAERLTFADAAERMGISTDAVRMRVRRGTLVTIHKQGRTFVVWPRPNRDDVRLNDRHTHVERRPERRSPVHSDDPLISALEARIASLEHQLTVRDDEIARHDEEVRRRDHIIARLVERLPAITAGAEEIETFRGAAQDAQRATESDVRAKKSPETYQPVSDTLALGWRR